MIFVYITTAIITSTDVNRGLERTCGCVKLYHISFSGWIVTGLQKLHSLSEWLETKSIWKGEIQGVQLLCM